MQGNVSGARSEELEVRGKSNADRSGTKLQSFEAEDNLRATHHLVAAMAYMFISLDSVAQSTRRSQ